jgi:hypothetical protein
MRPIGYRFMRLRFFTVVTVGTADDQRHRRTVVV